MDSLGVFYRVALFVLSWSMSVAAFSALNQHPGLDEVELKESSAKEGVHRLITSRVKRMSGEVQPESAEFVSGVKTQVTFEISPAHTTESVADFYRQEFSRTGQVVFECNGRGCGPSNYWSNQVFEIPRLYGPTEYQHYILAKIDSEDVDYVTLYFSQRATGQRFLHQESFSGVDDRFATDERLIASMLRLQRRFVFDATPEMLGEVRDVINANMDLDLALVAHSGPLDEQTLETSIQETEARAEEVKAILTDMGADTRNLSTIGAGPTAPIARSDGNRLELVKLN